MAPKCPLSGVERTFCLPAGDFRTYPNSDMLMRIASLLSIKDRSLKMRLSSSALVLLTILCTSTSASAQEGSAELECERGVKEACWIARFGRCAHENPRIAIPACTRMILNRDRSGAATPNSSFMLVERAQQYSLRATARAKLGNIDEALADYDRAIRAHGELRHCSLLKIGA